MAGKEKHEVASEVTVGSSVEIHKNQIWAKEVMEPVAIHDFITEPAVINISKGVTISPARFEFVRVDVSLKMPCYAEHVDETFEQATRWVDERLGEEIDATKEALSKGK